MKVDASQMNKPDRDEMVKRVLQGDHSLCCDTFKEDWIGPCPVELGLAVLERKERDTETEALPVNVTRERFKT